MSTVESNPGLSQEAKDRFPTQGDFELLVERYGQKVPDGPGLTIFEIAGTIEPVVQLAVTASVPTWLPALAEGDVRRAFRQNIQASEPIPQAIEPGQPAPIPRRRRLLPLQRIRRP